MEHGMLPLPEGKVHDFHGTTYIQILVVTLFSVTFAFATAVLILRIYTALRIVKHPDLSDLLITLAWGLSLACFTGMVLSMPYGLGRHLWNVTAEQLTGYYKYTLLIYLTYVWTPTLSKLAILVFYHQINPFRPFRACVYVTAASIIIYTVIFTSLLCGLCKPAGGGGMTCLNNVAIIQAVVNILTDIVLIILPVPMLRQLQLPRRQKVVVGGLLALGSAVVVASILRVPFLSRMTMSSDVTWAQASLAIWSSIELNFGIACNCMARLRPFVQAHMPKLMRYLDDHKNDNDAGRPDLAVAAPARQHGGPNTGDDDGGETWRCQENAVYTFRLHSFEGNAHTDVEDESGHIHVRREVTVDLEPTEAASRRMRSTDKLIRQ